MTRILIMSSDHQFSRMLQAGLERLEYTVTYALLWDHTHYEAEVVLLDDSFFLEDFLSHCQLLKNRLKAVMIVMGECHNEPLILKGMNSVIDDYVLKPFDISELEMLISKQLKRKNLIENLIQM